MLELKPITKSRALNLEHLSETFQQIVEHQKYIAMNNETTRLWHDCRHDVKAMPFFDLAKTMEETAGYETDIEVLKERFNELLENLKY